MPKEKFHCIKKVNIILSVDVIIVCNLAITITFKMRHEIVDVSSVQRRMTGILERSGIFAGNCNIL